VRTLFVAAATALAALATAVPAAAQSSPGCVGDTEADDVQQRPGSLLRYGIGPLPQAGQIGPAPAPAVPERADATHQALADLRPADGPFVLRLNRFFWSDGEAGFRRYLDLTDRFTSRGYLIELQVRYHPNEQQEGNIPAWEAHVREVVRRFGANRRVIALQIANEVNFNMSPDSSDGSYREARQALVSGVIAAKDEARKLGHSHLQIGFNWAYRLDPGSEQSFWQALRDRGGRAFVQAVDWIGLDAYPGTVFPPEADLDGYRDGMVNAMSALRCYAEVPGIPHSIPMKIEENGWPTFPGRSEQMQADVLEQMVRAVHDFRGTYNVVDYRWFNLRDGDTSAPQPFQHFGLMRSDYFRKPAFPRYQRLVAQLSIRGGSDLGAGRRRRARLSLRLRARRARGRRGARCARPPVRATVTGADRRLARRAEFFVGRRRVARDTRPPLSRVIDRMRHRGAAHAHRVTARVRLADGRLARLKGRYRVCARR
jgi:hypothetical protein